MDKDTAKRTIEWASGILAQLEEGDIDGAKKAIADGISADDLEPVDLRAFIMGSEIDVVRSWLALTVVQTTFKSNLTTDDFPTAEVA